MTHRYTIVGIGEALYDIIQGQPRLGGAPLNVAFQAHQLGRRVGGRGVVVSRIGQDDLGDQMLQALRQADMTTDFIQTDPDRPTGRVFVRQTRDGDVEYEIVRDSAWDMLWFNPDDEDLAMTCDAVCFGSLAQRDAQARNAIYRFLDATRHGIKLFDVNLRQEFHNQRILRRSCELATVVKMNNHEAPVVADALGMDAPQPPSGNGSPEAEDAAATTVAHGLIERFELDMVVLTRGSRGTRLVLPGREVDGTAAAYERTEDADPVGAGDAVSAAVLTGLVMRLDLQAAADLSNHMGAYVYSQPSATPEVPKSILDMVGTGA